MHLTLKIARKGCWVIGPDYRVSHPRCICAAGDVVAQRYDVLCDWLWDACHMAGVHWESRYKEFVARKARTIALSKVQGSCHKTSNNQPIHEFGSPLGIPYPSCTKKVSVWGFLQERKVWIVFSPTDVCSRHLRQKAEKGKFTGSEATTRFPQASCFKKPTLSVPETWGRMYDVLAWSAKGTRNKTRNRIPVQPRKARRN
jgi:hypothetical protein